MADHSLESCLPASLRVHQFCGLASGPRLIVLGAVHGDETCGTQAMAQLLPELDSGRLRIERGTLTLVPVTNPLAYQLKQRTGHRNLNRCLFPYASPENFEDQIANVLCPLLSAHDVLLDLHSFHTAGEPFAMLGPENNGGGLEPFKHAHRESEWAAHLGARLFVEGWLDTYAAGVEERRARGAMQTAQVSTESTHDAKYGVGTTEYMRSVGGYGITLECGQHEDPAGVGVARRAIEQTLAWLGMTSASLAPPVADPQVMRLVSVTDRLHLDDRLAREWHSFDPVEAGEPIAFRHDGSPLTAPTDGWVVFPNPRARVGHELFYFAQRSERRVGRC